MTGRARHTRFTRDERGVMTIEFVMMMPVFLATLAIAFELGRYFIAHQATVNNVRSASRFLSRSDLSPNDITMAENIVRTGAATGGVAPDYLASATVAINTSYTTFGPPDFSRNGQTLRIFTRVDFPLTIFGLASPGAGPTLPFVIVEDLRHVGV